MSRILYVSHDVDQPRGGVDVLYEHVAALRENGLDAFIVHATPGYRYRFAQRDVPVLDGSSRLDVLKSDFVVIPEDSAGLIGMCRELSCRKVLFCQNHFYIFRGIAPGETWSDFGFSAYLCASDPIRQALQNWFGVSASVVRPPIDALYFSDESRLVGPPVKVACMPRKGTEDLRLVQGLLAADGVAAKTGLTWLEIDRLPRPEVAARLQEAHIYVSSSAQEGLGLPPLEAMAAGCLIVGFTGGGGLDYASPENGTWVENGNPWALAEALAKVLTAVCDPDARASLDAKRAAGRSTVRRYGHAQFERDLMAFWTGQLALQRERVSDMGSSGS
jgi:glycosyltransferase involved in cell wall biosynthesis